METEGGFSDSPADHGGATKYGISLRYLAQQRKLSPGPIDRFDINHDGVIDAPDIADLTLAQAHAIYHDYFWPPASQLPEPLDAAVFDQIVNDGLSAGAKLLQVSLNTLRRADNLRVDGDLGPRTRAALTATVAAVGVRRVLGEFQVQAIARYRAIAAYDPSQRGNLNGWLNRAAELGNV
ncbi:MAG: glycosyl hydrolase 108 family protein [Caulobacteraceae bacterium]